MACNVKYQINTTKTSEIENRDKVLKNTSTLVGFVVAILNFYKDLLPP